MVALTFYDVSPAAKLIDRHEAVQYPYVCEFGHAKLEIDEGVFCPTFTRASPLLLKCADFRPGELVLDAFAGCGAFAINAALSGSDAVAVDLDPAAVASARKNAASNGVSDHVVVIEGTVEDLVRDRFKFDLILANPPLLNGPQEGTLGLAIFDPDFHATRQFIRSLRHLLKPTGRCYFLTSSVFDRYGFDVEKLAEKVGLDVETAATDPAGYETYRVHLATRRQRKRIKP